MNRQAAYLLTGMGVGTVIGIVVDVFAWASPVSIAAPIAILGTLAVVLGDRGPV